MPTALARPGELLKIKERDVPFSLWPTGEGQRRDFVQSRLFASDPWEVILFSARKASVVAQRRAVTALVLQGQDLFRAANVADVRASRPLLLYYSFMQLVKAYSILAGTLTPSLPAYHGISEACTPGGKEFKDSRLELFQFQAAPSRENIFAAFVQALTSVPFAKTMIDIPVLFNQILIGHRLFTHVQDATERFVEISEIRFLKDVQARELWMQIRVAQGDLKRLGYTNKSMLSVPGMRNAWRLRRVEDGHVIYEMSNPVVYTHRPSDIVSDVAVLVSPFLWSSVLTQAPFRRHYLLNAQNLGPILPQVASIYAGFYYLGSLTRYKPTEFRSLLNARKLGLPILEFLANQPMQFLYLMASMFAKQEVTKASIV